MTDNLRSLANGKFCARHNTVIGHVRCIHQQHGKGERHGNRNRVWAHPECDTKIFFGEIPSPIAHLNLRLMNLPRLNDNVRPIPSLISSR